MKRPFVYGMSVDGENFTDRELETKRLILNFENGINSILISPRRMGKTSLVRKVASLVDSAEIKVVYMDIYKCRTEYDFYEKYASSIISAASTKLEKMIEMAKEFIVGITPSIIYNPDPTTEFALSLGINPKTHSPEDILDLPERIAKKRGINIVVCIDEFQQIGEMPDSLYVQKTIRSVWQHHRRTSYCLFGSKRHLMSELFYSKNMPFYQFGDMFFLKKIPMEMWVPFIIERFNKAGKQISEELAGKISANVENYSAYVQQLAWNVLVASDDVVTEKSVEEGLETTMEQVVPLFVEQAATLSTYQLNLLRAICTGYHTDFGKSEVRSRFDLGSRSNLPKIIKSLIDRELIEIDGEKTNISDPLFKLWFRRNMM